MAIDKNKGYRDATSKINSYKTTIETQATEKVLSKLSLGDNTVLIPLIDSATSFSFPVEYWHGVSNRVMSVFLEVSLIFSTIGLTQRVISPGEFDCMYTCFIAIT